MRTDSGEDPTSSLSGSPSGRWLKCSIGTTVTDATHHAVLKVLVSAWTSAMELDVDIHGGARADEVAGDRGPGRPKGLRLIIRRTAVAWCPTRFTDADGMRLTCFATNTAGEAVAAPELRHRQPNQAEDRIRAARTIGLRTLPPSPIAAPNGTRFGWISPRSP